MKFPSVQSLLLRLDPLFTHRHLVLVAVSLGVLLTLPSLWNGFQSDDLTHRYVLLQKTGPLPSPALSRLSLFAFVPHDPVRTMAMVNWGVFPWWTYPDLRLALFRPLTSLTHVVDYALWANHPFMMHVQNLAWYALLVGISTALYRRFLGPVRAAGIAAIFYALDDAHGFGAGWLANRNAVICAALGLASVLLHDRWRTDGKAAFGFLAAALFGAALLGGEGAVASSAYLLGYAFFIEPVRRSESGSFARRLASLWPYLVVGAVYVTLYKLNESGARFSGVYIDPATEPLRFLRFLGRHGPILLLGQLGMPPSDISAVLAPWLRVVFSASAALTVTFIAWMARQVLARVSAADSAQAASLKFFAFGMLLSVIPISATFASNRLLFFVGFGAMGLVGPFMDHVAANDSQRRARVLAWIFLIVHGVFGPLSLPVTSTALHIPMKVFNESIKSFPHDEPDLVHKNVVMITNPIPLYSSMVGLDATLEGRPLPLSFRSLASATSDVEVERIDDRTLRIRPADAFNPGIDQNRPSGSERPVDVRRIFVMLDSLFRNPDLPFRVGDKVALTGMSVEVTEVNERGLATEALFRFDVPLEDNSLLWLELDNWKFKRSAPPGVGEKLVYKKK